MAATMTPLRVTEPRRMKMRVILPFGEDALQVVGDEQMTSMRARIQIDIFRPHELSTHV